MTRETEFNDFMKMIHDVTSRIDERVKILVSNLEDTNTRFEKILDNQALLYNRVSLLESRDYSSIKNDLTNLSERLIAIETHGSIPLREELKSLQKENSVILSELNKEINQINVKMESVNLKSIASETKMNKIFDFVMKTVWTLLAGYLLYKFGWQSPPN